MLQTSKTILAVVVTTLVVGTGVYLWQKPQPATQVQKNTAATNTTAPSKKVTATPAKTNDSETLEFVIDEKCQDFLSVSEAETDNYSKALKRYSVYARGDQYWPANQVWFTYSVYSPEEYNKMDPNPVDPTTVAQPTKILTLSSGLLVTRGDPQDAPNLPEGCGLNSITVKEK